MLIEKRILVVEDEEDLRGPYRRCLERRGLYVEDASNLESAIRLLNAKTYHIAIVDIMLAGRGVPNLDGLKILQEVKALDEGTKCIVLSSQEDTQISADTLQEYGASRYIKKEIISREGYDKLADLVLDTLPKCELITFGTEARAGGRAQRGVLVFLAGSSQNERFLVDRCLRVLKPRGGYSALEHFLCSFLERLTPLMPPAGKVDRITVDDTSATMSGSFWSKAVGQAITLVVSDAKKLDSILGGNIRPEWSRQHEVEEARRVTRDLCGLVFKLMGVDRSDFARRID